MTKNDLKKIMLEVLSRFDNCSMDEWYTTERAFAEFGIDALAGELKIDLYSKIEE